MTVRVCPKCSVKTTRENTYWYRGAAGKPGHFATYCRTCACEYQKGWDRANPAKAKATRKRRYARIYEFINFFKSERPCYDCGGTFPPGVMDFDHLRDKSFSIGQGRSRPFDEIRREIDKCQLVCANCHRQRTLQRGQEKKG